MFGFHKPRMFRSTGGCCICRAKSSSSRFTDSQRYESSFQSCFGLDEVRSGDICNACVLLVKRWKKLPAGSKKTWNHVVDAKAGSSVKATLRTKTNRRPSQMSRPQSVLKRNHSDAHSTTSSASPAQSASYSDQSDEGSDAELSGGPAPLQAFSFLDLSYWKRQKVCCGIVYRGRHGEVLIHPHLYTPCCQRAPQLHRQQEGEGAGQPPGKDAGSRSPQPLPGQDEEAGDGPGLVWTDQLTHDTRQ